MRNCIQRDAAEAWIKDARYGHSYNGNQEDEEELVCDLWTVPFSMTLSDLAKYSMTLGIVRPLRDS